MEGPIVFHCRAHMAGCRLEFRPRGAPRPSGSSTKPFPLEAVVTFDVSLTRFARGAGGAGGAAEKKLHGILNSRSSILMYVYQRVGPCAYW